MSCCGSRYGNGRTNKPLTKLSTAVVAPIASAMVTTAIAVNAGCFNSWRKANRMSLSIKWPLLVHHPERGTLPLLTRLNTAVFTPMPSASTVTAAIVKPGALDNCRTANLRSRIIFGLPMPQSDLQQRDRRINALCDRHAVRNAHRA
jgi:hypothetical protein